MKPSKPIFDKDSYEYELKCRRCGDLTLHHFGQKSNINYMLFAKAMTEYGVCPRFSYCKICKINTIQDLTTYTQ